MKKLVLIPVAWLALVVITSGQSRLSLTDGDRTAIRAINTTFVNAWLKDDASSVLSVFADDAILLPPNSEPVEGLQAIRSYWFPDDGSVTKIDSFDRHIDEIGGNKDLAFLRGTARLSWTYKKDGKTTSQSSRSTDLLILRRSARGKWLVIRQIWNSLPQ